MNKKILVVVAHPDDEVLGCGATIKKLSNEGNEVYTLILGQGKAARGEVSKQELKVINSEIKEANKFLGVKKVYTANFPDNCFDSVPLLEIVKKIEEIKIEIKPSIIYTHHIGDINIDHQQTHKAVLVATRPMPEESVKEIYTFEVPSSTEWNAFSKESIFIPNVFIDVNETIDFKIKAMAIYKSELRNYPHPRSLTFLKELAKVNGVKVGLNYSENFMLIRKIK